MQSNRILAGLPVPISASPMPLPMLDLATGAGMRLSQNPVGIRLDLSKELVQHPQRSFIQRATGDSMEGAGIFDGDLLVVDKYLDPQHGDIVVALVDGELTCKRYSNSSSNGRFSLQPESASYPAPHPETSQEVEIWGVVTSSVRRFRQS